MNAFGNISQQEAEQAVRIWSEHQASGNGPTIHDLAESLRISTSEAEALVAQVRSQQPLKRQPDKGVWISFAAAVGIMMVIIGGLFFTSIRVERAGTPVDFATAPMPPIPDAPVIMSVPPIATEDSSGFNAQQLNSQAWEVVDNPGATQKDLELAEQIALRANEMSGGTDPNILDTLARAYWRNGKFAEAVTTQKKAIGRLAADANSAARADFETRLADYVRARDGAGKSR
ncbi:MAG TPA: hypothetical protein PKA27_10615 [Fimbriimonadaceae bacterium]|nr:hypothetical protein [Fimbriimonadaceae bacterium]